MILSTTPDAFRKPVCPLTLKAPPTTSPEKVVMPDTPLWFIVLFSTALNRVSTSKALVKNDIKTLCPLAKPVVPELLTNTGIVIWEPTVIVGVAVILNCI